jgi:hypothetical protein
VVLEKPFSVRSRAEFDKFWISGIELGQMRSLADLRALSAGTSAADLGLTPAPATGISPLDDPPVTAQVWWKYAIEPLGTRVELLIDPGPVVDPSGRVVNPGVSTAACVRVLTRHVIDGEVSLESTNLTEGFGCVAINLAFEHMVTRLLPLTSWRGFLEQATALPAKDRLAALLSYRRTGTPRAALGGVGWFLHLLAVCGHRTRGGPGEVTYTARSPALVTVNRLLSQVHLGKPDRPIGRVTLNRPVSVSVHRSRRTVKVDAASALFNIRCDQIRWAVVDSGIDARHDWFRRLKPDGTPWDCPFENADKTFNFTRIVEAFDFTRQRDSGALSRRADAPQANTELPGDVPIALNLGEHWYEPPRNGHGTHVAGIIGGAGGLCPDIELYDFRVLGEDGRGQEFEVVAALRHILELTQLATHADPTGRSRNLPIHGVNLSVALHADVTSDACGWSLVCRACDELVRAGVVVVASAGNTGFEDRTGALLSTGQDYRTVSITDPGNTERVITVGSTDADRPREYGVSYFSARGPTADGRPKPDLVAPGNSITSAYGYCRPGDDRPNVAATLNGTSMAAAHVSGCAALLMARHRELIGKPEEVKAVLMQTATDLHRDRNFQGAGLIDALRAVQSI